MMAYFASYYDRLLEALWDHLVMVAIALVLSLLVSAVWVLLSVYSEPFSNFLLSFFALIYAIPSLAMLALFIPLTGLGNKTAIVVLVIYNQYLLLRSFLGGLQEVDPSVTEAAAGMGMTPIQVLLKIRLPLAQKALFAGVRIALISTIGIATIAATINAGGLGTILFDGLRTLNVYKIVWGSLFSAGLAIFFYLFLSWIENRLGRNRF